MAMRESHCSFVVVARARRDGDVARDAIDARVVVIDDARVGRRREVSRIARGRASSSSRASRGSDAVLGLWLGRAEG
jgi:hypothetical protein